MVDTLHGFEGSAPLHRGDADNGIRTEGAEVFCGPPGRRCVVIIGTGIKGEVRQWLEVIPCPLVRQQRISAIIARNGIDYRRRHIGQHEKQYEECF